MIGEYKIIGVCITKLHDELTADYVKELNKLAMKNGYRLLVFNSFLDFNVGDSYDIGAKSIYELINYSMLDAIVIHDECFHNKTIVTDIIAKAEKNKIPVITVYNEYEGCFSIIKEYSESYKGLISHVIEKHNAKKIHFIAGIKDEENSEKRLSCYKSVMEQYGLEYDENSIAYGSYWNEPTYYAIDKWVEQGNVPDAIVCANDSMALNACERLFKYGYRVPEDVIVTGFDGITSLRHRMPRLTTCFHDVKKTAEISMNCILEAINNNTSPYTIKDEYSVIISESCGCLEHKYVNNLEIAEQFYKQLEDLQAHEDMIYSRTDRIAASTDFSVIEQNMSRLIQADSDIILNSDFLSLGRRPKFVNANNPFSDNLVVFASNNDGKSKGSQVTFSRDELFPNLAELIKDDKILVFQSIYIEDEVCGYYLARMEDVVGKAKMLRRTLRILNLNFSIVVNRQRQEYFNTRVEKIRSKDSLTGLYNLTGLYEHFKLNYDELSKKHIAVSFYTMPQYKYIMENFGITDAEDAVSFTAEALQLANSTKALIARISDQEFIVVNLEDNAELIGQAIDKSVNSFFKIIGDFNVKGEKYYYVEINCGCVVSDPGWDNNLASFIKAAKGEMYLNKVRYGTLNDVLKPDNTLTDYELYQRFDLLISKNLFQYHFQPIVDAATGDIYAYEALMRTDSSIDLNPAQILDVAVKYKRLYDVERATLFNIFEYIENNQELFTGKRVFINTIPGCFLKEKDYTFLTEKYGHIFKNVTIELTEQNESEESELKQIRTLEYNGSACQIAIDDYGTGYSNIVNLLRYQPNVIKIDRYLISGVDKDSNKQHFISSTIEFAKVNNIRVLAEGVETREELAKVIELGVDLIQGYFTARPSAQVIAEIPSEIKDIIIKENELIISDTNPSNHIYTAKDNEIINLSALSENRYSSIELDGVNVTIEGDSNEFFNIPVHTAPDSKCCITIENVKTASAVPAISIGENGSLELIVKGDNFFDHEGILVPAGAELVLKGDGNLTIKCADNNGVALGSYPGTPYGDICINTDGVLNINVIGGNPVCIGGLCKSNKGIDIQKGWLILESKGSNALGIGSTNGESSVSIGSSANISINVVGTKAAAIGAIRGSADIICRGTITADASGDTDVGIGVLENGTGSIVIDGADINISAHCHRAACIGSNDGTMTIFCISGYVNLFSEGDYVCGIGNFNGVGRVEISGAVIEGIISATIPKLLGGNDDCTIISGGNIIMPNEKTTVSAMNICGDALEKIEISDSDHFKAEIISRTHPECRYTYYAEKNSKVDKLWVYLPKDCEIIQ